MGRGWGRLRFGIALVVELDWGGLGDGGVYGVEDGEEGYAEWG